MKKLKVFACMLLAALGGITISSCGVLPNEHEDPGFDPLPDREQDKLINKIFETKYLKADLDINVAYQSEDMEKADNYHVTGDATVDIQSLDNVGADVSLELDMNSTPEEGLPLIDLDFTYFDSVAYVDINNRRVKLATDDMGELLDLVLGNGDGGDDSESSGEATNIDNSGIKDIVTNIANMSCENKGDHYEYVAATTKDQPNLVITSDFDFNITSLSIYGIKYEDFTIDVNIGTEVLASLDNPIVSPETSGNKYINLTNYFGALRKVRSILDDERFAMGYELALTHYEPDTPDKKVYLGNTIGHLDMDLAMSLADLSGTINIADPVKKLPSAYTTTYHGQYIGDDSATDGNIFLDYSLTRPSEHPNHYKLSFSHQGLNDMWDLMGDSDLFGGKNIFDMIFGTSDKEYPIIDILTDATYRNLSKYGSINLGENYIEVDIDNYLFGGKGHGSVKIVLNENEERSISEVAITSLDINSYIVNGTLWFDDYNMIVPVDPAEFNTLDGLDDLIRDGVTYFRSNKYNLGVNFDIKNLETDATFSIDGDAQVNVHQKNEEDPKAKTGYDGYADLTINDFEGNIHTLKANANPANGEKNVYATFTTRSKDEENDRVNLKVRASRDSISVLFDQLMGYEEDSEGEGSIDIMEMLAPYIVDATYDTLERMFHEGDYFSILRDETIVSISTANNHFAIELNNDSFGVNFKENIMIDVAMTSEGKITSITVTTIYDKYDIDLSLTLKNNEEPIPVITDKEGYIPFDSLVDIASSKKVSLDLTADINKVISGEAQDYVSVRACEIDANINDKAKETDDLWDRLYARISGEVRTSGETTYTPFILGYDDNLSFKFGEDAKVTLTRANVRDVINRGKSVLPKSEIVPHEEEPTSTETTHNSDNMDGNIDMFLKIMEIIGDRRYTDYINKIKSSYVDPATPNVQYITLDNSLFREGDTTEAIIAISYDDNGITDLALTNFRYDNYALNGSIGINNRTREDVDVTGYNEIFNIVNAALNCAIPKDIVVTGDIYMSASAVGLEVMTRHFNYSAFVHKENDPYGNETVYGYLKFENVPFLYVSDPWGVIHFYDVSDNKDSFDDGDRTFEIYFESKVDYEEDAEHVIHTVLDEEGNVSRTSTVALRTDYYEGSTHKYKEKFITTDEFMDDMTYYILNYGLGIKAKDRDYPSGDDYYGEHDLSTKANDFFNFHNYHIEDNYTPNLSTLLDGYEYHDDGMSYKSSIFDIEELRYNAPSDAWVVTIDGGNLLNNEMLKDMELFTCRNGSGDVSYLEKAILTTKVTAVGGAVTLKVGFTADYDYGVAPSTSDVTQVRTYIASHPVGYKCHNGHSYTPEA